jgi:NADPH-dependent glutamate synthase beta subunit-like oxidoreductase
MIGRMTQPEQFAIAVVGGAVAGAEAARIFSESEILTVVMDQNPRPYGKIEDGLPRWHIGLRRKEYSSIDQKLMREHVHFVPCTKLGRDLQIEELTRDWGFHAVVLANGAWRDRPLGVEEADDYIGKGLVYQNPFIHWFNHYPESGYTGEQYEILDGTIVIGGGLGSIDVAKAVQLELVLRALRERGIEEDLVECELRGIPSTLRKHRLLWQDLGLQGTTIYYRRQVENMPLVDEPENPTPEAREKVARARRRVVQKAMTKYLFRLEPLHLPSAPIIEGDRLVGLRFVRTRVVEGKAVPTDETVDVRAPMVISSIGSVPERLPGIAMRGELYNFSDWDLGRLEEYPNLFSAGNVVTGKGNIVDSRKHARFVANEVVEGYVRLADQVKRLPPISAEQRDRILERVRALQSRAGYGGDYQAWIEKVTPPDLL